MRLIHTRRPAALLGTTLLTLLLGGCNSLPSKNSAQVSATGADEQAWTLYYFQPESEGEPLRFELLQRGGNQ